MKKQTILLVVSFISILCWFWCVFQGNWWFLLRHLCPNNWFLGCYLSKIIWCQVHHWRSISFSLDRWRDWQNPRFQKENHFDFGTVLISQWKLDTYPYIALQNKTKLFWRFFYIFEKYLNEKMALKMGQNWWIWDQVFDENGPKLALNKLNE